MTLFSKSYISYRVKVLCYQAVLCVPIEQIGRKHVYIKYTQKVLKVLLLSAPKKYFCAGKTRIRYFSGQVFFVPFYLVQEKMVIASGSENNVSLRHSPISRRGTL